MGVAAPSCLIPQHQLQLSNALSERCQLLQFELADQVATLPLGNERWLQTERELAAAEQALARLRGN
ncbi:hypothetical protein SynA1825c_01497 [Synechococcus sp. A18-25c]|uniref:hypothetical protein n=1 Tax=Synechococcus sp. A18-25c TaxID=1866938 RepID=UPI000C534293|nr:hypothetical protein [Synechococcus sp. A18-25c]MAN19190.1 hypothetical protein [Synechococcus sp. EAC657]MEC7248667.1 hypothetical protein [Cyanobacteriota bacterium]QNI48169.1 hypothetical protein SynA1560_01509 [Synechococcus sp. A15-60]MEC7897860.1 hypothetical protein [Cyanobacteriota bacterium]QNJ19803.1 hypothetical protein SynA1825c_01497 [Synechococcus sp. A18-25c]